MKTKTDLYTKIVLTVIAIFLGVIIFKDIDFVTKAQAGELNQPALSASSANEDKETMFYIYENDKLFGGFGKKEYLDYQKYYPHSLIPFEKERLKGLSTDEMKDIEQRKANINMYHDIPKYCI